MQSKRALFVFVATLGAVIPALAVPGPTPDDLERNRRLLDTWRNDPEHYARLRRDLKAFSDIPHEDQFNGELERDRENVDGDRADSRMRGESGHAQRSRGQAG